MLIVFCIPARNERGEGTRAWNYDDACCERRRLMSFANRITINSSNTMTKLPHMTIRYSVRHILSSVMANGTTQISIAVNAEIKCPAMGMRTKTWTKMSQEEVHVFIRRKSKSSRAIH